MSSFNFSTTIHGKERDYTIRSLNFDSIHRIIVNVADGDKVIHTHDIPYDAKMSDEALMTLVKQHHEDRVESLQELLKISAKLEVKPELDSNHKLGLVFLNSGLGREAVLEFNRALALEPDNAPILNHLGLALLVEEKFSEAVKIFQRAAELRPTYPDLHNNLGLAYLMAGRFSESQAALHKALEIHPRYAESYLNLGLCMVMQGTETGDSPDREAIQGCLDKAVELNVYFDNEYLRVARNYLSKNQWAEARQALLEARTAVLSQRGSEIYHEFYLRLKYGEEGVDRQATERYIAKLEDILAKHPNYVDIHNDLGVAYLIQCRFLFNRAINEFKRALSINPEYAKAKKNLKLAENEGKGFLILLRAILYF